MCNQCVTPVHLGIKGLNILILGSVHRLGPGRSRHGPWWFYEDWGGGLGPPLCLSLAIQLVPNSTGLLKILLKPGAWKGGRSDKKQSSKILPRFGCYTGTTSPDLHTTSL